MATTDIPGILADALAKLKAIGPQCTATDIASVVAEIQPVTGALAGIDDEPTLQTVQTDLSALDAERGRLSGLLPGIHEQWNALESTVAATGAALVARLAALPNPSQAALENIQILLQGLVQKVDENSPVEQLADLEARVLTLEQQMESWTQEKEAQFAQTIQALQTDIDNVRKRLNALFQDFNKDRLQDFQSALIDFLGGEQNDAELLALQYQVTQTDGGFDRIQWALIRQYSVKHLGKLIDFIDLVDAGNDDIVVSSDPGSAAELRQSLMRFVTPLLQVDGEYGKPEPFSLDIPGIDQTPGKLNADVVIGHRLHISDAIAGSCSCVITSAALTERPFDYNQDGAFGSQPGYFLGTGLLLTMNITLDTGEKRTLLYENQMWYSGTASPANKTVIVAWFAGWDHFADPANSIIFDGHDRIQFQTLCIKQDIALEEYLSDPKAVLADIRAALRNAPATPPASNP